jgi:hypothetical protein
MFHKSPDLVTCLSKRQNFVSLRASTPLKQRVSRIGRGSALPPLVNTLSVPVASLASLPQPMKSSSAPASSPAPGKSPFQGQLHDAIQERKGRSGTKDPKPGDAGKKEIPQPPITLAVVQPTPPPPPVAAFGLPSAGVEAGSVTEAPSTQTSAVDTPTPDTPANPALNPPAPPPQTVQPDPKTSLAFALRLADVTPNRDARLAEPAQQPAPMTKTIPSDLKMDATFALPRAGTPQQPVAAPPQVVLAAPATSQRATELLAETPQQSVVAPQVMLSAPPASLRTTDVTLATPIKVVQPALQPAAAATPIIAIAPPQDATTGGSGSHSSDGGASGKDLPKHLQPQPAADLKSFQQAGATSEAPSSVSNVTSLQTPSPATVPASPAPAPSGTVTAAIPVERVSIPLAAPNPTSRVTDVSVNIQVPRADASGDDRVAIRMLQVGSEIHVSVRTPDSQLTQSLRQDLGKLTTGLDQGGFRTETWRPAAAAQSNANPQHQSSQDSPNRDPAGSNARSAGNSGQGAGEQRRRQQDDRPRWVAELEQQKDR